eukprot:symbB.v1.2.020731.t1/scaffold1754.1/size102984/6
MAVLSQAGRWAKALALSFEANIAWDVLRLRETLGAGAQALKDERWASDWPLTLGLLQSCSGLRLEHGCSDRPSYGTVAQAAAQQGAWQWSVRIMDSFKLPISDSATAQELADQVWLGAQQGRWTEPWIAIAEALIPRLSDLDLQEFCTVVWSFGTLGLKSRKFCQAAEKETLLRFDALDGGSKERRVTVRMLADLAFGFCALDSVEMKVFVELQQQLARMIQSLPRDISRKMSRHFFKKSLVVLWVCHFVDLLDVHLCQLLQARFIPWTTEGGQVNASRSLVAGDADVPFIVMELPDRLVVQKPVAWQVEERGRLPAGAKDALSMSNENNFSTQVVDEAESVNPETSESRVETSRSLPAKRHEGVHGIETRAASADNSKLGRRADENELSITGDGSSKNVSKAWLVFRMCEVYAAPRLPHVEAQDWTLVADSAESMKFGVCKFCKMPNVNSKERERWKQMQDGHPKPHTAPTPRRPRAAQDDLNHRVNHRTRNSRSVMLRIKGRCSSGHRTSDERHRDPLRSHDKASTSKTLGLQEKWWLEYDPPKANYISGQGRGPFGGNSINKQNWPRQMVPIEYKKKWEKREKLRFAFRKHGYELDVPKLGG